MLRSLAIAGLMLTPACTLVDVQAEVQQTCMTYPGMQIEAAPPGVTHLSTNVTIDQLDAFHGLADQGFTLDLESGQVAAASGVSSFSFIQHASVSLASGDPDSTLPSLAAFGCEACDGAGDTLVLPKITAADVAPYVKSGSLVVSVDFGGQAPQMPWSIDITVCTTDTISYSLAP